MYCENDRSTAALSPESPSRRLVGRRRRGPFVQRPPAGPKPEKKSTARTDLIATPTRIVACRALGLRVQVGVGVIEGSGRSINSKRRFGEAGRGRHRSRGRRALIGRPVDGWKNGLLQVAVPYNHASRGDCRQKRKQSRAVSAWRSERKSRCARW